ncbi:hypothetical protein [Streptomyces sp. WAC06614]|uniref:hypothetical protein n=1 Tax=Streptomyces sp. WAC06614 TaxID=2487416 RepID=UPI000F777AD8|nr:hypothetical protein [Streptomyces sp. WAC06614]RSS76827.1 hypothetical protein EF918_22725 [Streptomyces sp. WAC06614]
MLKTAATAIAAVSVVSRVIFKISPMRMDCSKRSVRSERELTRDQSFLVSHAQEIGLLGWTLGADSLVRELMG